MASSRHSTSGRHSGPTLPNRCFLSPHRSFNVLHEAKPHSILPRQLLDLPHEPLDDVLVLVRVSNDWHGDRFPIMAATKTAAGTSTKVTPSWPSSASRRKKAKAPRKGRDR